MSHEAGSPLDRIHKSLSCLVLRSVKSRTYRIPSLWNTWEFAEAEPAGRGEVFVNPHRCLLDCIDRVILPARGDRKLAYRTLSQARAKLALERAGRDGITGKRDKPGDWLRRSNIYSMMIRVSTAWDHNADGTLKPTVRHTETGTFLKSILLLPLLRKMGVSVIYFLPVTKCSRIYRKGELGCPYSAKNFYEFEPDLHDRLLDREGVDIDTEFAAFVEAAHALEIRVMVDLAPRTAARDSDLLLDHPDWFYWIDRRAEKSFGPPQVPDIKQGIPTGAELARILRTDELVRHREQFRFAPNVDEPVRWKRFAMAWRRKPRANLLQAIKREFGVVTAPGFSDVVNDPQPPWSDVTYLRLYLDHPKVSVPHLSDPTVQPPYAFTDSIKASLFPGNRPNYELWEMLSGVLPHYQKLGVDGARVDMGHALPNDLQDMIVRKPRKTDPDFGFLAEELSCDRAPQARKAGYNAIIGSSWWMEPRHREGELHKLVYEVLPSSKLPAFAAAETPDTPRATVREGGRSFARLIAVLNHFLPNSFPFLNGGLEVFEKQPMNLGLDIVPPGRFALPRSDPYYGKLAYFDAVALHWKNAGAKRFIDLLSAAGRIRERYIDVLASPRAYFRPTVETNAKKILAFAYRLPRQKGVLLIVANVDFGKKRQVRIAGLGGQSAVTCCIELQTNKHVSQPRIDAKKRLALSLPAGELAVIRLKY